MNNMTSFSLLLTLLAVGEAFTSMNTRSSFTSTTLLQAKKPSMAQKRKRRGNRFIPKPMERPKVLDEVPRADEWQKTISTGEQVETMQKSENAAKEAKSQAAALIATQRKSVDVLTHVKEQIQALPVDQMIDSLLSTSPQNYFVFDGLLGQELSEEIGEEGRSMFDNNKLELDLSAGVTSGEYAVAIKGGQDQYADCPRSVEFVVCLTRHLSGMLNGVDPGAAERDTKVEVESKLPYKLDETASMAGVRVYNRKARLSSLQLLTGNSDYDGDMEEKPFGYVVNGEGDEVELRKVSFFYFTTPDEWDDECGGGITFKNENGDEIHVAAKNDRLLMFSSEDCLHRLNAWKGKDGVNGGSYIVTHFVEERQ